MAADTKVLALGIVVGAMTLGIMYQITLPSPPLRPTSTFPVRKPAEIPNESMLQSFKQSVVNTITNIIDPSEDSDEPELDADSIVTVMRKHREDFLNHTREQGVNITADETFRLFPPGFTCPYKEERLGGARFGKWACGIRELYGVNKSDSQNPFFPNCVMYSFGVGNEVAFDEAVLGMTNCKVFAYDHTVKNGIPSRTSESNDPRRMVYRKIGLKQRENETSTYLKTIKELMAMNGHDWIDILKVDTEGAEYGSLNMLMDDFEDEGILPFDQLLVEIHVLPKHDLHTLVIPWFKRLEAMGLRVIHAERNPGCKCFENNFVNLRGKVFRNSTFSFFKNGWTNMNQFKETTKKSLPVLPKSKSWFNFS